MGPTRLACLLTILLITSSIAQTADQNPKLLNLPANQWVAIHQEQEEDDVTFKRQEHGGSCLDTRRCRIVLFGSNTHGEDWTNSPLIFDIVENKWIRLYENDDVSTYRAIGEEALAVAGENGDHPWAMHTFGAVEYDPQRDEMIVSCWPEHLKPGRFTDAMKDVWPTVKKHATWTYSFTTSKWTPLPAKPQHFFPYATAFDSDRNVVVGYGGNVIAELGGEPREWKRFEGKPLCGYHNNAVYDPHHKSLLVFGSHENSDEMIVYNLATKEHTKMPTPGKRPPKDQHNPMCYEPEAQRTVVVVDRKEPKQELKDRSAETWLYDLPSDSWTQVLTATLPFGCGMNYDMHYDPRHMICLLVTEDLKTRGWPVTVYALRLDVNAIPATQPTPAP